MKAEAESRVRFNQEFSSVLFSAFNFCSVFLNTWKEIFQRYPNVNNTRMSPSIIQNCVNNPKMLYRLFARETKT